MSRVAAFIKRLLGVSLYLSTTSIMQCLLIVKQLLIKYPVLERLIDDEENEGSGVYTQSQLDPDLAHALSTKLYELVLFMVSRCIHLYLTHLLTLTLTFSPTLSHSNTFYYVIHLPSASQSPGSKRVIQMYHRDIFE